MNWVRKGRQSSLATHTPNSAVGEVLSAWSEINNRNKTTEEKMYNNLVRQNRIKKNESAKIKIKKY